MREERQDINVISKAQIQGYLGHVECLVTLWIPTILSNLTILSIQPFQTSGELVQIMMATANENLSAKFCNRVLKFFTKLFQLSEYPSLILLYTVILAIEKKFYLDVCVNIFT